VSAPVRHSLGQRLLLGLVVVSFVYSLGIAWFTVRDSVDEVYELFDVHLAQTALALLRVTDPDDSDPVMIPKRAEPPALGEIFNQWPDLAHRLGRSPASDTPHLTPPAGQPRAPVVAGSIHSMHEDYEKNLRYQVWGGDGSLLLRSANAPDLPMTPRDGYSESTDADGQVWRHYGVWDRHHDFHILVSEAHELRNRLVRNIALHVASPLALGLPVLIALLWFSIHRGLNPLGVLTRAIETREPQNLMPLDVLHAPWEVRPMVQALNELLARMTQTLEGERRFTANAAHELRTPLAAIQAQLYVVRSAQGEAERARSLDQLQRGVERGIRLVGQMLTLARLDPEQALPDVQAVALAEVAQAVCAELAPLALQREQTLELHAEADLAPLAGNADMLSMLLSNLVDNAIRYTPRGGHIDIAVRREADSFVLEVGDDGPGIPEPQRERVFDRFYRIASQTEPGTGLGLAICQRIAQLHGARVTLGVGANGKGVLARVLLK
jgi:two-component system sensor histidine kinase QseC